MADRTPDQYEWHVTVLRYNLYGTRAESRTPAVIVATSKADVTDKVRVMFGATYDDFRKFWSHGWELREVRSVLAAPREVSA